MKKIYFLQALLNILHKIYLLKRNRTEFVLPYRKTLQIYPARLLLFPIKEMNKKHKNKNFKIDKLINKNYKKNNKNILL